MKSIYVLSKLINFRKIQTRKREREKERERGYCANRRKKERIRANAEE